MNTLVSKDEPLKTSVVNVGYHVLKALEGDPSNKLTLPEIYAYLGKQDISGYRPVVFGLIFLDSIGAMEFHEPYFHLCTKNELSPA